MIVSVPWLCVFERRYSEKSVSPFDLMIIIAIHNGVLMAFPFFSIFQMFSSHISKFFKVKRRVPWRTSLNASAAPP